MKKLILLLITFSFLFVAQAQSTITTSENSEIVKKKKKPDTSISNVGIEDDDDDTHEGIPIDEETVDEDNIDTSQEGNGSVKKITPIPNPTKTKTPINTTEKIFKIEIYDRYGLLQHTIRNSNTIDLLNQENGIYMVKIYFENSKIITKTIIKQ